MKEKPVTRTSLAHKKLVEIVEKVGMRSKCI